MHVGRSGPRRLPRRLCCMTRVETASAGRVQTAGVAVVHAPDDHDYVRSHERASRNEIARRLAALKGFEFAGEYDPAQNYRAPLYLVPSRTLLGVEAARRLGVACEHDLFGGVVPWPFVATKAITHGLVAADARAPEGWSPDFASRVRDAVPRGFSAFTLPDARRACALLLERGPVRLKPVRETGGRGQAVFSDAAAVDGALAKLDETELSTHGLVLEEDLAEVTTYSVGQVRVGALVASYYGTQKLTPDNDGAAVYGGSDLIVARGDFDALLAIDLPEAAKLAVMQARLYDGAAQDCFPGLFASRRNYDIAAGRDAAGIPRSGVLEQSWRIGGASGAEIGALEAFAADPTVRAVRASCTEVYGDSPPPPPHATVYFRGEDERVGRITKYTLVEPHGDA